jgi:hypothetical protein
MSPATPKQRKARVVALIMVLSMWQQTGTAVMLVPAGPSTSGRGAHFTAAGSTNGIQVEPRRRAQS